MTDFKYRCSGTLVSTRHVITAAHCLTVRGQLIERDLEFIVAGRHHLHVQLVNEKHIFVSTSCFMAKLVIWYWNNKMSVGISIGSHQITLV